MAAILERTARKLVRNVIPRRSVLDPVMRNIETFLEDTQKTVNGTVTVSLKPYHFSLDGIESANDLMNTGFGQYGEMNNAWTSDDAKGFIKILGNAQNIFSSVNNETYE